MPGGVQQATHYAIHQGVNSINQWFECPSCFSGLS